MRVQIVWRPGTDVQDIYILQDGFSASLHRQLFFRPADRMDQAVLEWRDVDSYGKSPDPSLSLPGDVLQAIVREGAKVLPPSEAMARHLQDAVAVRDRVLDAYLPRGDSSGA